MNEVCSICGCKLHREGDYASPSIKGRSHATEHHFVAERFFGRTKNKRSNKPSPIFSNNEYKKFEGMKGLFCYECHEELIHNPVLLPAQIEQLAKIVKSRGLDEDAKTDSREKIGRRIQLLHEVIKNGLDVLE